MSFTKQVMLGLACGAACGLFFGERTAFLQIFATGFVKLLQMTVLPYVVLSIVNSLGSLSHQEAKKLGLRVGAVILLIWAVGIAFAFLLPLCFPSIENASFFSTSLLHPREEFNFVDLYIPSNPFHSLANNIVPAIVLFSVMLGVALIGVPRKDRLLEVTQTAIETVSRATRFVIRLTPYGIFAIAAHAAGTLSLEQLERLQIYLLSYIAVALLLALWVLPGLVSMLTPIPLRSLLAANREALLTAFVAGDLFIVLPSLMEGCEQTLKRYSIGSHDEHKLPEVIIPAAFNFPHAGKLLSLSFIVFAGWFSDSALAFSDYPQLAGAGILAIFGSLNAAIPFLLDLFRIPADTFQLYLATGVLNARFGALVAAVHAITVALLGSAALAGAIRFRPARLIRYGLVTLVLTVGILGGLRILFSTALAPSFDGSELITRMQPLHPHADAVLLSAQDPPPPLPPSGGVYDAILARGELRVCFFANRIPFAFRNHEGKLIGFEVEAAHLLAEELGVQPRFIEIPASGLSAAMASDLCDIVMSGVLLTPRRESDILFSRPYLDETLAFAVLDHRRAEFAEWESIRNAGRLRIAVPNLPHYLLLIQRLVPNAELITYEPDQFRLDEKAPIDAYAVAAEYGSIQTLLHPRFTISVPSPDPVFMPVAYPVARRDLRWAEIVNTWIELRQKDGTFERLKRHWILGQSAAPRTPRWSLLDQFLR